MHGNDPASYLTDVLAGKAVQFLDDPATVEPFFLMVAPMAPHSPAIPSGDYDDLYSSEVYPKNANLSFNEADVADKPFVGFRHADGWVFEKLLTPVPDEVGGEYYTGLGDPVGGDRFELANGYLGLDPGRRADLEALADGYAGCAGDSCRVYDSQDI